MSSLLKKWTYQVKRFSLIPVKLSNKKWVWFQFYYKLVEISEYASFEEGIGDTTYRLYKTIKKWK